MLLHTSYFFFMSEAYLKHSQTSKMKLLANVLNASRDVFRIVFSIQNIFKTSRMSLFTKIMNNWKLLTFSAKTSIIIYGSWKCLWIQSNYFHQKLHLRSLRGQICLCMYLVPQIWRLINEITISKLGYEETQKNV